MHSFVTKNSQARGKSQGWAAFDLKQRGKQPQVVGNDPFPPLPTNSSTSLCPSQSFPIKKVFSARSFSSAVHPPADFPPIVENTHCNKMTPQGGNDDLALDKLQRLNGWADKSLIEDVMVSENNDTDKATTLLKEMVSCDDSKVNWETKHISDCHDVQCKKGEDDRSLLEKTSDLASDIADLSSTLEDALRDTHEELNDVHTTNGQRLFDAATANMKLILGHLKSLPVEPEWEENDVYLSHRRDALKMMRLASRHSRAATNAFIRGDHYSAQEQSLKARKEWLDAERLNAKAAKEILSVRNTEDNQWKLDLHGLHAAEAVQALQEHLKKIETPLPIVKRENGIVYSSNVPIGCIEMDSTSVHCAGFRQRRTSLQVITGVGKHSRGQAALPAAVRNFLIENSYHFDETRPGVITVSPKFHHR